MRDIVYESYGKNYDKIVIHVGYPKTGTSFLQLEVFPKLQSDKLCIISDESLIGRVFDKDASDMEPIALMLKRLYPKAKIIVGIREQKSMLKSLHNQYLKDGGYLSYEKFLEQNMDLDRLDYDRYINLLKKLFGKNNVWIYRFEDFKNDIDGVIKDMCEFIGCDVPSYDKNKKYAVGWSDRQIRLCRIPHRFKWFYKPRFRFGC